MIIRRHMIRPTTSCHISTSSIKHWVPDPPWRVQFPDLTCSVGHLISVESNLQVRPTLAVSVGLELQVLLVHAARCSTKVQLKGRLSHFFRELSTNVFVCLESDQAGTRFRVVFQVVNQHDDYPGADEIRKRLDQIRLLAIGDEIREIARIGRNHSVSQRIDQH